MEREVKKQFQRKLLAKRELSILHLEELRTIPILRWIFLVLYSIFFFTVDRKVV